jgi:hypothetical protein
LVSFTLFFLEQIRHRRVKLPKPMKRQFLFQSIFAAALVLTARGADTNKNSVINTTNPPEPTLEERRARIQAWRAEHSGLTNLAATNPPPSDDSQNLPIEERRARLKARIAEANRQRYATNFLVPAATNAPTP